jgi:hypothetical protein
MSFLCTSDFIGWSAARFPRSSKVISALTKRSVPLDLDFNLSCRTLF